MNRGSATFLQVVIALVGLGALALMLWEPHIEGRNAHSHATLVAIYFKDPFLAYAYFASIPFFVALYQALKVVGYAGGSKIFTPAAVRALRIIKLSAIAMVGFVAGAEFYIFVLSNSDDRAGGVFIGVVIGFASIVVATAAAMFERILQNAVDLKSENDLTV